MILGQQRSNLEEPRLGYRSSMWTPAALFGAGQAGHWSEYNPGLGRVFQDAAGTTPATLPDQPVGLAKRLAGSVDAAQATALSRPTLARWPKGGRRNTAPSSENMTIWGREGGGLTPGGGLVVAAQANAAGGVTSVFASTLTEFIISGEAEAVDPAQPGGSTISFGGFSTGAAYRRGQVDLVTGQTTIAPGAAYIEILENTLIGANKRRFAVRVFGDNYARAMVIAGPYVANLPAGRSFIFSKMSVEVGGVRRAFQDVFTQNDITENGVPDVWHLWNDGGDSLNAAPLPAGTYGLAYVDVLGGVTITTVVSDGTTPINLLRAERQAQVILRQGAFTAAEDAQIRSYWGGLYV